MNSSKLQATERAYQDLLKRQHQERQEASEERRQTFTHEHEVRGRSYSDIAAEVGLTRGRVIHIIKGYRT